ncbi:FecCD family ABC transporter permease [Streptomyces mobaraensis]|uniref:Iron chelate uptake ABC transporter family permease subunit n=1 Tax=Streptomyces mobaraensis TaxID=35621 RepID=A0A5N5VYV1_STRMB|nr:iron chelate uptake ABC transporter family permease subunit [Streptomyces mobaraensis]KAB7832693.1 iron chelate uptake ABC transporter family permease subunit [Streptomyces mobaraensis]
MPGTPTDPATRRQPADPLPLLTDPLPSPTDLLLPTARGRAAVPPPTATTERSLPARAALLLLAVTALAGSLTAAVRIGTADVSWTDLARVLGARLGLDVRPPPPLTDSLVWDLRLPRALMAALVGAALAVCGTVLQAVTRNALADPYLLGVSSGASTGAVTVIVLGVGAHALGTTGGALAGALLAFGLLLLLLRRTGPDSTRIVLTGVVVGQLFTALTSLVLMASADADTTRAVTHWLLGSMAPARWDTVLACATVTPPGLLLAWLGSNALDGLAFGADTAASLGIGVRRTRTLLLVVTAVLTAVAVATVGAIGFVGLIVPHAVRFLVGPAHRVLLPYAALAGAVFLVWTDTVARVAFAPREVPVGVITALLGVPLFLLVLRRRGEL